MIIRKSILQLFLYTILLFFTTLSAQRNHIKINEDWKFKLGTVDTGVLSKDYNDKDWESVDIPHDWDITQKFDKNNSGRNAFLPGGIGFYRKDIFIGEDYKNKQIEIQFDGVYRHSELWVNGKYVGKQYDGYTSFYYDITPFINIGTKNIFAVKVDNSVQPNCRWYSGSGIYRDVWLTSTNTLYIEKWGTSITTPKITAEKATVHIQTTVQNYKQPTNFELETIIYDADHKIVKSTKTKHYANSQRKLNIAQTLTLQNPEKWSIETPYLYSAIHNIFVKDELVDSYASSFGVRSIRFDGDKGFFLNDKNVKIKGVCIHHEAGNLGAAVPISVWERRLDQLKLIGCNAIRTAHNPVTTAFLDLCDQKGFLVMDEFVDKWGPLKTVKKIEKGKETFFNPFGFGDPYFELEWEKNYRETIKRDRNHPSVIIWSVGNENNSPATDKQNFGLKKYASFVRTLDSTRPVVSGMERGRDDNVDVKVNDILESTQYMDFVAMNYGEQWCKKIHDKNPKVPFLSTESYVYFNSSPTKRFANIERSPWLDVIENDFNMGLFLWEGFDYLGESKKWPKLGSKSGLFDKAGFRKPASYLYEAFWSEKPMVHIEVYDKNPEDFSTSGRWGWPEMSENWNLEKNSETNLVTYTNCDTVKLYLNNKLIGTKKLEDFSNWIMKWKAVNYKLGTLKAVGIINGKAVCEHVLKATSAPKKIKLKVYKPLLTQSVIQVEVFLLDKTNNKVQNQDIDLNYVVKGGKIIGIDNGNMNYYKTIQNYKTHATFLGRTICYIKPNAHGAAVELTVSASGIKTSSIMIK